MQTSFSFQRLASVARKEFLHILRDPATLFFSLFIPLLELFMLGYAIDTNVRDLRTVIFDQARTIDSRHLVEAFVNSKDMQVRVNALTEAEFSEAIVAGKARVGIWIPEDFSRKLEAGEKAAFKVIVDGSESSVAGEALSTSNSIALKWSFERLSSTRPLPVEVMPQILYNPATKSANFFIPGLMVVMCQMMAIMLSANAIVREKENGTLEQLFMTPVRAGELILGKLSPYLILTFAEFCVILFLMRTAFQVPIHGHVFTLLMLTFPFVLSMLGLGLFISTRVGTREAAGQMAMGTMMPSIFLSGYVFPLDSMWWGFYALSQVFPTTWLIDAARGVILRGAGWQELWLHSVVLWLMAIASCALATLNFHKRLS